ncbi:hypothetical protein K2173_026207 [Erythroxylum novogranatense]|uniref:Uncharacterized protein n=1 Tax=Erythroxylum novogranatense TaxID=1862640 RepID=A0AAV8SBX6_9ROSI|nr:hypothetical protein K2173_026207 [Erythroxylum novogranatense]
MGSIANEKDVLKLVHPGRHVEIHKEPISAAEVLKKNPRHSVARPDVFRYPWIVVNPKSLLNLGQVYFIVPNRTIYQLLKAHKEGQHPPGPGKLQSLMNHGDQEVPKLHRTKSDARTRQNYQRGLKQSPPSTYYNWTASQEHEDEESFIIHSKVESWLNQEQEENSAADSPSSRTKSYDNQHHSIATEKHSEFSRKRNGDLEVKTAREETKLKSCLRKHDSPRKSRLLRVSFLLPGKDDEQQRKSTSVPRGFLPNYQCNFVNQFVHPTRLKPAFHITRHSVLKAS